MAVIAQRSLIRPQGSRIIPQPTEPSAEDPALIAVLGAGAVGLGIGSCLLAAGERVRFATRTEAGARALNERGLERTGLFGDFRCTPDRFAVAAGVESLRNTELDWILVCTKTPAAAEAAEALRNVWDAIGGARRVVLCHNGWGSAAHFAERLPRHRLYSARVITGFRRSAPHAVEITAHAEPIRIGSLYTADLTPLQPLGAAITRGGVPCEPSDDIESELWSKMLYNCSLNPLGALIGVAYGELGRHRATRAILEAVIHEIFGLLDATGRATRWRSAQDYIDVFWNDLLPPTAAHESSMLQDLRAGRPTEVGVLNGAVVDLALEHGFDVPVNRALLQLIRAREQHRQYAS